MVATITYTNVSNCIVRTKIAHMTLKVLPIMLSSMLATIFSKMLTIIIHTSANNYNLQNTSNYVFKKCWQLELFASRGTTTVPSVMYIKKKNASNHTFHMFKHMPVSKMPHIDNHNFPPF